MTNGRPRILVVDDDIDILELLKYNFENEGFEVKSISAGKSAVRTAKRFLPDLFVLDIMMPDLNGIAICEEIRSIPSFENSCIFFLTAKSGSAFQQTVLDIGGDDYIEKLMGIRSLMNKVKAVLVDNFVIKKRVGEIRVGQLLLNRIGSSVRYKEKIVPVSEVEFELLFFFAQNPQRIINLEHIMNAICIPEIYPYHKTVRRCIDDLKAKISPEVIHITHNNEFRFGLS
jgi:two-component system alkaline phosphatase synthesis response regulator PhoP